MYKILLATLILFSLQLKAQDFWEEISTPLTNIYSFHCINKTEMLLGGSNDTSAGLYVSDNEGASWQYQNLIDQNYGCGFIGHHNETILAYVGSHLFKMNGLYDWNEINAASGSGTLLLVNDTIIIKGNWETVEKSVDGGYTWRIVHNNYPNENVETIIQHPNGDLFFGTYAVDDNTIPGVYTSTDLGETWSKVGLNYHMPMALATDSEGNIYAGSWGHYDTGMGGVYKSTDLGVTWDTLKLGMGVTSLVVTSGDTIYAGANNGVYMSTDLGTSWALVNSGLYYPYITGLSVGGDGHLYTYTDGSSRNLYRSLGRVSALNIEQNSSDLEMVLYPNPVHDRITISLDNTSKPLSLQVLNMAGKVVLQQRTALPHTVLTEHFSPGVYLVRIHTENNHYTQKFIKN